jgi:hypothetical protein
MTMADMYGNATFNEVLHRLFASDLKDAGDAVARMDEMIAKCYPNADHGAADRARRALRSALRDLTALRVAMEALSRAETGSVKAYWVQSEAAPAVPSAVAGTPPGDLRCTCTPSTLADRGFNPDPACPMHGHLTQPPVVEAVPVEPPGEAVILAARHLDATEGRVWIGSVIDVATRSAMDTVLTYVARAHNARRAD